MSKITEFLATVAPHLTARVSLYPECEDGKIYPISLGWGCPCFVEKNKNLLAHDGYPLLGEATMSAGETRELGYWFMLGEEAAIKFRTAGRFFLWEGRFVGEAIVL